MIYEVYIFMKYNYSPLLSFFLLIFFSTLGCVEQDDQEELEVDYSVINESVVDYEFDQQLQDNSADSIVTSDTYLDMMINRDIDLPVSDMNSAMNCAEARDATGNYLLALSTLSTPRDPLLFYSILSVETVNLNRHVQMSLQSLSLDQTFIETCSESTDEMTECTPIIESQIEELSDEGLFELTFDEVVIVAEANPFINEDMVVSFTLNGQIYPNQVICGTVSGESLSTESISLDGTMGMMMVTSEEVETMTPILQCPVCPNTELPIMDEEAPTWPEGSVLHAEPLNTSRARLTWTMADDNSLIVSYAIFQNGRLITVVPAHLQGVQVGPLVVGQYYDFQVQAEDEHGNQSIDGPTTSMILDDLQPPRFEIGASLDVIQLNNNSVRLNWPMAHDNQTVTGYRIFQDHLEIANVADTEHEFIIEQLIEGREYLFRVEAIDEAGNLSMNGLMSIFILQDRTGPSWPATARVWANEINEDNLRLQWDAADDHLGVRLYRVYQANLEVALISAPQRWVRLEGLNPDTIYEFEILAEDEDGNLSQTQLSTTIRTADNTPPMWSDSTSILIRGVEGDTVTIGWSGASDQGHLAQYVIYRDNIMVAEVPAETPEVMISGVSILVDYEFRVEAVDAVGNQSTNGPRLHVRLDDANPPSWPSETTLSVLETNPSSIRISWSAALDDVGIMAYEISVDGHLQVTTGADVLSAELTGLNPNSTILVAVTALDGTGNRMLGPTLEIQLPDYQQPTWPTDATVNILHVSSNEIELGWTALASSPSISQYVIFQDDVQIALVDFTTHTWMVNDLPPKTNLHFRIEARGPTGQESDNGPSIQVSTLDLDPPTWPITANLSSSLLSENQVTLTWSTIEDGRTFDRYKLYQDHVHIATIQAPQHNLLVNNLEPARAYLFRVEAVGPTGQESSNGPQLVVNTPDLSAPTWPSGAQVTVERVTVDSIELSWPSATDQVALMGYRIQSDTTQIWNSTEPHLSLNQLQPATQYILSIYAVDTAGNESNHALTTIVQTLAATALTDLEVYQGLSSSCIACHHSGSTSPYFGSFAQFQQLVMNDSHLVDRGHPDSSLLIRILEGNGDSPWNSMPLGAMNYSQLALRGQTDLTMDELRNWILGMGGN